MSKKKVARKTGFIKVDESYNKDIIRLKYAYRIAIFCAVILAYALIFGIPYNSIVEIFKAGFFTSIGFLFSQKISE